MKRFRNILVVLDWQKQNQILIERGIRLAEQNGAKISFIETFDDPPLAHQVVSTYFDKIEALYSESIQQHIQRLKKEVEPWLSKGIEIEVSALMGNPVSEIIKKIAGEGHDLVMIGLEAGEKLRGPLLLGLPLKLMRKCPCAVWAMKPTKPSGFNRIVAAVDPRDQTEEELSLLRQIMEIATSLAISEDSELHVLHAWSLYGEAVIHGRIPEEELDDWLNREKDKSTDSLLGLLEPFMDTINRVHIHKGPADKLLPLFIENFKADLLVMGTVSRTGIPGILIGNTAEKVLQTVDCSVLAVKPDNFVTSTIK